MYFEYAVEPAAIGSSWDRFKYIFEKFGFDKGRLVSRMPEKWEKKVIAAAKEAGVPNIKMASIIDRLRGSKRLCVVDFGRSYDSDLDWLENALSEHGRIPFHAIVATNGNNACKDLVALDDFDEGNGLVYAPTSQNVPRTAGDIADALFPLVLAAKEVDIVDPYFDLRPQKGDYTGPLSALLRKLAAAKCPAKVIRIHFGTRDSRPPDHLLAQEAPKLTNGLIPPGFVLQLYEWAEKAGGEDFHDRFVLADCGGLMIGAGLSATGPQETAAFTLLDGQHVQNLRRRFEDQSTTYSRVGSVVQIEDGKAQLL